MAHFAGCDSSKTQTSSASQRGLDHGGKGGDSAVLCHAYNGGHGIHLVVLFAEYGELKFPISYRVYQGKHQVCVLADSGFESAVFLEGVQRLGFIDNGVSMRC